MRIMSKFKNFAVFGSFLLLISGCSVAPLSFSGTMSVPTQAWDGGSNYSPTEAGDMCNFGEDQDYPDINAGTQVTLRDSTGATVGLSRLTQGRHLLGWSESGIPVYSSSDSFMEDLCVYEFEFEDVETDDEFFSIEIGKRGELQYTREQLETAGVQASLG